MSLLNHEKFSLYIHMNHIRGCQVRVGAISTLQRSLYIGGLLAICSQQDISNISMPKPGIRRDSGDDRMKHDAPNADMDV